MNETIGIVVAMQEEYKYYEEILTKQQYKKQDIIHKKAFEFQVYVLAEEKRPLQKVGTDKIIIVKSHIGKANAAIATTLLIQMFNPNIVLNTGAVGGIEKHLEIGDLLVGKIYKYCDVDVTALGCPKGQVPQMPEQYQGDAELLKCCQELDSNVYHGTIGTTDSFISDKSKVKEYAVSCVDMEATAIAQTCYHFNIPFLAIKAISDQADGKSPENFKEFVEQAGKNTAQFVTALIIQINK